MMHILSFNSPYFLAPMAGFSDYPFRQLCRSFGAGLAITEMVDAKLLATQKNIHDFRLKNFSKEKSPRCIQLVGREPNIMAKAAQRCVGLGSDIIDLNFGCAIKKILKKKQGAYLLKEPNKMLQIIDAVIKAVDVPVTIKMRTGWQQEDMTLLSVIKKAEEFGVKAITIHGRTALMNYTHPATYEFIKKAKEVLKIPVIANGDIDCLTKAQAVMEQTKADAVMIGRGALGQPWIFAEMLGEEMPDKKQIMLNHLKSIHEFYGEDQGVKIARKHVVWYFKRLGLNENLLTDFLQLNIVEMQKQFLLSQLKCEEK